MKNKFSSFLKFIFNILIIGSLLYLGYFAYNKYFKTDTESKVEKFVSNVVFENNTKENNTIQTSLELPDISKTNAKSNNVGNTDSSTVDKYFYNQLDDYSKIIYNALLESKENMKTGTYQISLGSKISNLLNQENGNELLSNYYQSAIEAYTYDNPDVFYIDYSKLYLNIETTTVGNNKTYKLYLNSGNSTNYLTKEFQTKEQVNEAVAEMEKVKAYFINNKQASDYQNIKIVHDYLVDSIEYDQTTSEPNIYDIYGALHYKKCVCEGYARAFKYILDGLDIPCVLVSGVAKNSQGQNENHAWNYVQLNGSWYAIDCTWDDPVIVGGGILSNSSKYKYFLKGKNEMDKDHFPDGKISDGGKEFSYPNLNESNFEN